MDKKTKKILKIAALILALAMLGTLAWFANAMIGNPVSRFLATKTAKTHLEENYGDTAYKIDEVMYSFKDGHYYAHVSMPESVDGNFSIEVDMLGRLIDDHYDTYVAGGHNTSTRLDREYRNLVDSIFRSDTFAYVTDIDYGTLEFIPESYFTDEKIHNEVKDLPDIPWYGIIYEDLIIDGVYDVRELGKKAGHIILYVDTEDVTVEKACEILLDVKGRLDNAGIGFYCIDLVVQYPRTSDEAPVRKKGRVEVDGFLYTDIYEDGLYERVEKANEEISAYHAQQDALMKDFLTKNGTE